MVRPLRIDFPGALHHVMSRGNERQPIVRDDADRQRRLDWLRRNAGPGRRPALEGRSFAVVAGDLDSAGFDAPVAPVGWRGERAPLAALIAEPRSRRSGTPVGSAAWVELLGSGGGEDVDRVLLDSAAGDEDRKRDAL